MSKLSEIRMYLRMLEKAFKNETDCKDCTSDIYDVFFNINRTIKSLIIEAESEYTRLENELNYYINLVNEDGTTTTNDNATESDKTTNSVNTTTNDKTITSDITEAYASTAENNVSVPRSFINVSTNLLTIPVPNTVTVPNTTTVTTPTVIQQESNQATILPQSTIEDTRSHIISLTNYKEQTIEANGTIAFNQYLSNDNSDAFEVIDNKTIAIKNKGFYKFDYTLLPKVANSTIALFLNNEELVGTRFTSLGTTVNLTGFGVIYVPYDNSKLNLVNVSTNNLFIRGGKFENTINLIVTLNSL